jgi:hypothetical protein
MWRRLSLAGLLAFVALASACATDEEADRAQTTTVVRTASAPTVGRTETRSEGGGLLDALGALVGADDVTRCVEDAAGAAGESSPRSLRAVAREVERLRRLRFRGLPRTRYLRRAELERRIRRELESYPDREAQDDARALIALGAVPRRTNLKALMKRVVPSQVAGYYDPEARQLFVGSAPAKGLDAVERLTLAHELDHALTDQRLGFPALLEEDYTPDGREDAALAGLALVEGDATLLTEAFATEHLSLADAFRSLGPALAAEEEFEQLPYFLQASLIFPYSEGLTFVCKVFERGGWKAVNRAYRRPPQTSAQVMFPERYFAREPAAQAPDPRPPGSGWTLLDEQAFGAASLLWLFEAPGGETAKELADTRERAAAWAGGTLSVWSRQGKIAVGLTLVERRGERDLCASMRAWLKAAERRGSVRCAGSVIHANLHA